MMILLKARHAYLHAMHTFMHHGLHTFMHHAELRSYTFCALVHEIEDLGGCYASCWGIIDGVV